MRYFREKLTALFMLGLACAIPVVGAGFIGKAVYDFSTTIEANEFLLSQHVIVDELGAAAPLSARAWVAFSRAPQDAINSLSSLFTMRRANAQSQNIDRGNFRNHQSFSCGNGNSPTVVGATKTSGSCDFRGEITSPTAATATITFGTAFASAPICTVVRSDAISQGTPGVAVTTAVLTLTVLASGTAAKYNWTCWGVMP